MKDISGQSVSDTMSSSHTARGKQLFHTVAFIPGRKSASACGYLWVARGGGIDSDTASGMREAGIDAVYRELDSPKG